MPDTLKNVSYMFRLKTDGAVAPCPNTAIYRIADKPTLSVGVFNQNCPILQFYD